MRRHKEDVIFQDFVCDESGHVIAVRFEWRDGVQRQGEARFIVLTRDECRRRLAALRKNGRPNEETACAMIKWPQNGMRASS